MISLIAAIQKKDRGIGLENKLIFRISDDLKRFKALTTGHPIIMGRKTFDSIGGKPLQNRTNIVITRQDLEEDGVVFVHSLPEAIEKAKEIDDIIFIIGGAEIYSQALPFADRLELTVVESDVKADTFFPEYKKFSNIVSEEYRVDKKTGLSYSFITLSR